MMNTNHSNIAMNSTINTSMMSGDISEPSSPESTFDENDLLNATVHDDVTAQLAAAGPIGVAAAAAIATGRKRKRPHSFETNPSIRKRQQTRLLRKLKNTIEEYTTRVGQQAVILCCTPGKPSQSSQSFKVFGSQPLENVMRNCKSVITQDLESALAQQTPQPQIDNTALHELPPLVIDGIPTPVDKMTQAQLRAFIPEMLKYSTGRSKPGWGKVECRPIWWPNDVPWANVRSDVRSEEEKKKVSWTHALRTIVKNCYKHHGREDLMPEFDDQHSQAVQPRFSQHTMVQTINNPDGTVSIIHIDTGDVVSPQVVTLADGTQAHVVQTTGLHNVTQLANGVVQGHEATHAVQTLAEVAAHQPEAVLGQHIQSSVGQAVEVQNGVAMTEATINQEGQLILTGGDSGDATTAMKLPGLINFNTVNPSTGGLVTIPVSMYQTVMTNIPQLSTVPQQTHSQPTIQLAIASQQMTDQSESSQSDDSITAKQESDSTKPVPEATQAVEVMTVDPTTVVASVSST